MNAKRTKKLRRDVMTKLFTSLEGKTQEKDAYYGNKNKCRSIFRARKKNENLKRRYGLTFENVEHIVPAGKTVTPKGFRKSVFDVPDNLRVTKPVI